MFSFRTPRKGVWWTDGGILGSEVPFPFVQQRCILSTQHLVLWLSQCPVSPRHHPHTGVHSFQSSCRQRCLGPLWNHLLMLQLLVWLSVTGVWFLGVTTWDSKHKGLHRVTRRYLILSKESVLEWKLMSLELGGPGGTVYEACWSRPLDLTEEGWGPWKWNDWYQIGMREQPGLTFLESSFLPPAWSSWLLLFDTGCLLSPFLCL